MSEVDLVDYFCNRNIEGIDASEIVNAFLGKSKLFRFEGDRRIVHIPSNRKIVLSCAGKYFEPTESYYKTSEDSSCQYASSAYGTEEFRGNCNECIIRCITKRLKIRPSKIVVFKDYFKK